MLSPSRRVLSSVRRVVSPSRRMLAPGRRWVLPPRRVGLPSRGPMRGRLLWAVLWLALGAGALVGASGCAGRGVTLTAVGWAWPLPPPEQRSADFAARARSVADMDRLKRAMAWAGEELTGRGSAVVPRDVDDPVIGSLLRQVQAREAARRHLAERIAALPMPNASGLRGPTQRLGDPGRVSADQAARVNELILAAPVAQEREVAGGRLEVTIGLKLENVARVLLGEPVAEEKSREGTQGTTGTQETQGTQGTTATTGRTETQGTAGAQGAQGTTGRTGTQGAKGKAVGLGEGTSAAGETKRAGNATPVSGETSRRTSRARLPLPGEEEYAAAARFDAGEGAGALAPAPGVAPASAATAPVAEGPSALSTASDGSVGSVGSVPSVGSVGSDLPAPFPAGAISASGGEPRWDPRSASPEARVEAQRRAERLARRLLWEKVNRQPLADGTPAGKIASILASVRRVLQERVESAPVRSVVWDDLGRCRVTVTLDWDDLVDELQNLRTDTSRPRLGDPMNLP